MSSESDSSFLSGASDHEQCEDEPTAGSAEEEPSEIPD